MSGNWTGKRRRIYTETDKMSAYTRAYELIPKSICSTVRNEAFANSYWKTNGQSYNSIVIYDSFADQISV